jgi:glutamyl-tRNA synthetase
MDITHVIRGIEYLSSTPKYNLLYKAFGWEVPQYIHLPPVMRDQQHKLSKRHGDASFEDFVQKGYLKEAIVNYIALLGWSPPDNREIFTLAGLAEVFSLSGISKSPAIFDEDKLKWMNGEYIRALPPEEFERVARPYMAQAIDVDKFDTALIALLIQPRTEVLTDIPGKLEFLEAFPKYDLALFAHKKMKTTPESALPVLLRAKETLAALGDYSPETLHDALLPLAAEMGIKNGQLLWPVRIAISGTAVTPGGATEIASLLGKQEVLRRMEESIARLRAAVQ